MDFVSKWCSKTPEIASKIAPDVSKRPMGAYDHPKTPPKPPKTPHRGPQDTSKTRGATLLPYYPLGSRARTL